MVYSEKIRKIQALYELLPYIKDTFFEEERRKAQKPRIEGYSPRFFWKAILYRGNSLPSRLPDPSEYVRVDEDVTTVSRTDVDFVGPKGGLLKRLRSQIDRRFSSSLGMGLDPSDCVHGEKTYGAFRRFKPKSRLAFIVLSTLGIRDSYGYWGNRGTHLHTVNYDIKIYQLSKRQKK